jgi:hypothetical protein
MICSSAFQSLAVTEGGVLGMSGLRLVVIRHPLGGLPPDEVALRARDAVDAIATALTLARP